MSRLADHLDVSAVFCVFFFHASSLISGGQRRRRASPTTGHRSIHKNRSDGGRKGGRCLPSALRPLSLSNSSGCAIIKCHWIGSWDDGNRGRSVQLYLRSSAWIINYQASDMEKSSPSVRLVFLPGHLPPPL